MVGRKPATTRWQIAIFLIFNFLNKNLAQQPQPASSTSVPRPVAPTDPPADFGSITFSLAATPEIATPDPDTLPDAAFRQYDPARRKAVDYGNLGNLGTAARPLFWENRPRLGFDAGIHANDLYRVRPENLRFFRNTRSLSDVRYSRGLAQDDGEFAARFARTFTGGLNISLDFKNINQLGRYRYQRAKHNGLSVGGWLPVGKRYDVFLIFAKNTSKQQENGGIADGSAFGGDNLAGVADIQVRWSDERALSRHASTDFQLVQHLKIAGKDRFDSTRQTTRLGRRLQLSHTLDWGRQTYKFADEGLTKDTLFGIFRVDERGIRHFLEIKNVENRLTLATFKPRRDGRATSDRLAVGLLHRWFYRVWQEPELSAFSNTFLTGDLAFEPSDRFNFAAAAQLGVLKNIGEYQISGNLKLSLGAAGELRATLLSQRFPPSLLAERAFVSKRQIWKNDFQKPVENSLSATYALPRIGFEATAATHLLNNFIYFDFDGRAQQAGAAVQISQILLRQNLKFRALHFDNTVALQTFNRPELVHLPKWFSKNSLYFSGKIFKKAMLADAGFDFRTNGAFAPDAYQPVVWQFHLQQDSVPNPQPYPWLDFFIALKIKNFRLLGRVENLSNFWDAATPFYQTMRYPQPPTVFRIGIRWRFLDSNVGNSGGSGDGSGGGGNRPPPGVGRG